MKNFGISTTMHVPLSVTEFWQNCKFSAGCTVKLETCDPLANVPYDEIDSQRKLVTMKSYKLNSLQDISFTFWPTKYDKRNKCPDNDKKEPCHD